MTNSMSAGTPDVVKSNRVYNTLEMFYFLLIEQLQYFWINSNMKKKSVLMRKLKRNHKAYASWASSKYNNNLKFIQTA